MAIRPAPYSDAEIAFVRRLSGRVPNREIAERFAARFGREPTAMSIRGLRRNQLMPTLRKHHVYTDAEIAFVRMLSGRKPNREIAALFNRRFHADVSPTAISVLRYRHDMPLTIMRHTPGQRRFVFDRIGHMGPEELHDLFVSKFGRVTYGAFKTFMWDVMREGRQA
ncbi:MAG: hypothetical protein LBW85_01315 [Deltaproteobacteria bacterium]|nr:hypothetical protein [Deltaproteobacteria bacterium]